MRNPIGEWGEGEAEAKLEEMMEREEKRILQRRKERLILNCLGVVIGGIAVYLCLTWFDWRLLVVIFVAMFGNNLSQK